MLTPPRTPAPRTWQQGGARCGQGWWGAALPVESRVPSRDSPCVPCRRIGECDPRPHRVESALGRLGNKPKMGPKSTKNKLQLTCRIYFFITLYFENVEPNPKAKNLHLGFPS